MSDIAIKIDHVSKEYRLGAYGGSTLKGDLQSFFARIRGKEDPNAVLGEKSYKKNERFLALKDINMEINKGEALGIIGHNGAGKSTLLKLLSRVTTPTKGSISIDGRIASMLEVGTGFHPELTGKENIYLNGAILGMTKAEITRKFDEIVAFAEMERFINTPVKRYSSGMYVKLAFAVAAHLDSEILLMDEVLAVGDAKFQQKSLGKMGDAANVEGRTVLYVSHNMNTVRQLCNKCAVLSKGQLVYYGNTEDAIALYLDNAKHELVLRKEFTEKDQSPWTPQNVIYKSVSVNKHTVLQGKKLCFKETIDIKKKLDDIYFRVVFTTLDTRSVGTATSARTYSLPQSQNAEVSFEVDTSNIAPGIYNIMLYAFTVNDFGSISYEGVVNKGILVSIEDDTRAPNYIAWSNAWGDIKIDSFETEIKTR